MQIKYFIVFSNLLHSNHTKLYYPQNPTLPNPPNILDTHLTPGINNRPQPFAIKGLIWWLVGWQGAGPFQSGLNGFGFQFCDEI